MPDARSMVADLGKGEFRLRFSPQTWTGKIGSPAVLADQKLSGPEAVKLPADSDYCAWNPAPAAAGLVDLLLSNDPEADVSYSSEALDKNGARAASIAFYMKTHAGSSIGTLQCFFPRADSAARINFDQWVAVVGGHLTFEIRR